MAFSVEFVVRNPPHVKLESRNDPAPPLFFSIDNLHESIRIKFILLGILSVNHERRTRLCGLQDSGFVRYPTAKRVALAGPPHDLRRAFRKSPLPRGQGAFFWCSYTDSKSRMKSRRRGLRRRRRTDSTLRSRRRANEDSALIWNWYYRLSERLKKIDCGIVGF
jgi:hypothetical protein